jgi:hypothetical protein
MSDKGRDVDRDAAEEEAIYRRRPPVDAIGTADEPNEDQGSTDRNEGAVSPEDDDDRSTEHLKTRARVGG